MTGGRRADGEAAGRPAPEILPGERLLWAGRPARGIRFHRCDLHLIPLSLLFLGLALFAGIELGRARDPSPFPAYAAVAVFLLVGAHFLAGRFLVDARRRSRLAYGLTNLRAIVLDGERRVESVFYRRRVPVALAGGGGRSRTIRFGRGAKLMSASVFLRGSGLPWSEEVLPVAFRDIEDAAGVFGLVEAARAGSLDP